MRAGRYAVLTVAAVAVSIFSLEAFAGCSVQNRTSYDFNVESGNTSNQRLRARSTMSIASGVILGESPEGKTISGSCREGESLVIEIRSGVPILMPR